jgi:hypothetical protein
MPKDLLAEVGHDVWLSSHRFFKVLVPRNKIAEVRLMNSLEPKDFPILQLSSSRQQFLKGAAACSFQTVLLTQRDIEFVKDKH